MRSTARTEGRPCAVETCFRAEPALVNCGVEIESWLAAGASSVVTTRLAGYRYLNAWIVRDAEVKFESKVLAAGVAGKALAIGTVFGAAVSDVSALRADDGAKGT